METIDIGDLIPGLPEELALDCVAKLHFASLPAAVGVCRRWRELFRTHQFYKLRKSLRYMRRLACLVQADVPAGVPSEKVKISPSYGVVVFDHVNGISHRLKPVPKYPDGLPLFCQIASTEGRIVVMGGWDPITYDVVRDVFIYDFVTGNWKEGTPMPTKRSFYAIGSGSSGKVYVAGGHDENKCALSSAWVYDVNCDKWTPLSPMCKERDECEGLVAVGDDGKEDFWVVSGYGTENQGSFGGDAEVYDAVTGKWRVVEGAWKERRCPRGSVGMVGGQLVCWRDIPGQEGVRIGTNGAAIGNNRVLVTGSELQGGRNGFYLVDLNEGQMQRIAAEDKFCGVVQCSCSVEI